jgi:hypothetical protein
MEKQRLVQRFVMMSSFCLRLRVMMLQKVEDGELSL